MNIRRQYNKRRFVLQQQHNIYKKDETMERRLEEMTGGQKEELVASLSCLTIGNGELTAEKLQAVATASGNTLPEGLASLFANVVSKSKDGMKTFSPPPGGGGGGGGGAGG